MLPLEATKLSADPKFTEPLIALLGLSRNTFRKSSVVLVQFRKNHAPPVFQVPFSSIVNLLNPLTPMLALTGRDEPWPFFHFWHHHCWPKLASSMLNFCGKRRSIQWCPDQSAQKVEQKTQTKISCHYTWPLHSKSCPSQWRFLRSFLTASKPIRRSITAVKKETKGEKGKAKKKIPKIEKP